MKIFKNEHLERPRNMNNLRCVHLYDTLDSYSERKLEICANVLKDIIDDDIISTIIDKKSMSIEDMFYLLRAYASDKYYQN